MDQSMAKEIIEMRTLAGKLFNQLLIDGTRAGMLKRDAVIRACRIVLEEIGIDMYDAIPEKFEPHERIYFDRYKKLIISGIKAAVRVSRTPTIKAICERKVPLKELPEDDFREVIARLVDEGQVRIDNTGRKTAYRIIKGGK